jgi:hypothetical protein
LAAEASGAKWLGKLKVTGKRLKEWCQSAGRTANGFARPQQLPQLIGPVIACEETAHEDQNPQAQQDDAQGQHDDGDHHAEPQSAHEESDDHRGCATQQAADEVGALLNDV